MRAAFFAALEGVEEMYLPPTTPKEDMDTLNERLSSIRLGMMAHDRTF